MPSWLSLSLAFIFFFATTFLGTWAIREGGSFAFLTPSYWKKQSRSRNADQDRPERHS